MSAGSTAEWNGTDWYVIFGHSPNGRQWEDGLRYGFISAGGAPRFRRAMRRLPLGARVWAYLPRRGYAGVGEVIAEATQFDAKRVRVGEQWVPLARQPLAGKYKPDLDGVDNAEYAIAVRWINAVPERDAFWRKGMFAKQPVVCQLSQEYTLSRLTSHFDPDGAQ